jgi:hypothetical protein
MAWDEGAERRGSGAGLKIALVVIIVLLLGGVAAGVGFLMMNNDDDEDQVAEVPQPHNVPVVQPPVQYPPPTPPLNTNPVQVPPTNPPDNQEVVPPVPQKVTIRFNSEPSGARVYERDKVLGETPYELLADRGTEERHFTLKLRGYRDHEVAVVPDQDQTQNETLRRARRRPTKTRPTGGDTPTGPGGLFKANPFGNP